MTGTLQITLRDIEPSAALSQHIRRKVAGLEKFHPGITSCRVVAQAPQTHKRQGGQFVIRLDITVPGGAIVVNRDHHEDIYAALREAFRAVRRQLDDMRGAIVTRRNGAHPGARP